MPAHLVCFPPFFPDERREHIRNDLNASVSFWLVIRGEFPGAFTSMSSARLMNRADFTVVVCCSWADVLLTWGSFIVTANLTTANVFSMGLSGLLCWANPDDASDTILQPSRSRSRSTCNTRNAMPWRSYSRSLTRNAVTQSFTDSSYLHSLTIHYAGPRRVVVGGSVVPNVYGLNLQLDRILLIHETCFYPRTVLRFFSLHRRRAQMTTSDEGACSANYWCIEGVPKVFDNFKELFEFVDAESFERRSMHIRSSPDVRKIAALVYGLP
ncbi:hypothetical protein C8F01DRAFT_1260922 [Mycena amicta]|nr:hypothetical protein C8F01DRAFT_1260922 [Mycena amicta]